MLVHLEGAKANFGGQICYGPLCFSEMNPIELHEEART